MSARPARLSRPTRRNSRLSLTVLAALGAALITALLAGCGGAGPTRATANTAPPATPRHGTVEERLVALERLSIHQRRVAYLDRVRHAVVHGAASDFAIGARVGGPSFEACVKGLLREALDGPTISNLVAVYRRPHGVAYAAQALNGLTAPLAASCGHRSWVPELIEAARGLRSGQPIGAAIEKLGVTYGPYLGKRCRHVAYPGCEPIGIDVVFGHAATRVVAQVGDQQIKLRTPGKHNGITYRDWVGTFTHTGLAHTHKSANRSGELLYVPVELRVHFASGRRSRALLPHVLVSSGWG
jgi:hypothetical protein